MSHDPLKNDPSSQWPAEFKEVFDHLKVPSLYDCVLTNEKLSFEIRRQNKDLKGLTEGVQLLSAQLNSLMALLEEEFIEYEEEEEGAFAGEPQQMLAGMQLAIIENQQIENNARDTLIEMMDAIVDLAKATKQIVNQWLNVLPKIKDSEPVPPWLQLSEEFGQSIVENVDRVRYQMRANLNEWQVEIIDPQPGEPFNAQKHYAIEYTTGGTSGTIARVIRIGYRQEEAILRFADVIVYT